MMSEDILPFVTNINMQTNPLTLSAVMLVLVVVMGGLASAFGLKMITQK
jgi:hypothetical protein